MAERPTQLLTLQEVADELHVSIHTTRSWAASRKIGVIRLGRAIRVRRDEVDRLVAQGEVPAAVSRSASAS